MLGTGWPRHGHMHIIQIMQQASGQRPEINHQVVKTTSDSDQNSCSFRFQWSFSWPLPLQLDFKHIDIGITWPLCVAHFDLSLLGCRNQMMEAVGYCRFDASPLPGKSLNNAQRANSLKSRCFLIGGILRGRNIRHGKSRWLASISLLCCLSIHVSTPICCLAINRYFSLCTMCRHTYISE